MFITILFIPIFESIFGLLTKARLLELADKEKSLIRKLSIEAPGTFEHTLLICGLAEEAARMIEGDIDLINTGALYHDIGKLHAMIGCMMKTEIDWKPTHPTHITMIGMYITIK